MALLPLDSVQAAVDWLRRRDVCMLTSDSRCVAPGDAFIAWPGHLLDGRQYVRQAVAAGARACLVEATGAADFDFGPADNVATLAQLEASSGPIASAFLGDPSERLRVVACTGTNGKTSTSWWTAQALTALGQRCAVVGTLGIGTPPHSDTPAVLDATGLTTPDPLKLQSAFRHLADTGFAACAIEASSIGLSKQRLAGTRIEVSLFTNFTQDHLDFHGSMDAYWQAKRALFDWPGLKAAVLNIDDARGLALSTELQGRGLDVWTCSRHASARLRSSAERYVDGGLSFEIHEGDASATVASRLIGAYNVSNLLVVIGGLRSLGVTLADAVRVVPLLTPVPGRMQKVAVESADFEHGALRPEVVVDYAHTPGALEQALLALQPLAAQRGGALWCVFGCGGNRDAGKRPLMGALAQRLAQRVVVTSDNPRLEAPAFILLQIVAGLAGHQQGVRVIEDRRAAIRHAVRAADARDVILIAGKGHEDYQDIRGEKLPFSDVAEAQTALLMRGIPA